MCIWCGNQYTIEVFMIEQHMKYIRYTLYGISLLMLLLLSGVYVYDMMFLSSRIHEILEQSKGINIGEDIPKSHRFLDALVYLTVLKDKVLLLAFGGIQFFVLWFVWLFRYRNRGRILYVFLVFLHVLLWIVYFGVMVSFHPIALFKTSDLFIRHLVFTIICIQTVIFAYMSICIFIRYSTIYLPLTAQSLQTFIYTFLKVITIGMMIVLGIQLMVVYALHQTAVSILSSFSLSQLLGIHERITIDILSFFDDAPKIVQHYIASRVIDERYIQLTSGTLFILVEDISKGIIRDIMMRIHHQYATYQIAHSALFFYYAIIFSFNYIYQKRNNTMKFLPLLMLCTSIILQVVMQMFHISFIVLIQGCIYSLLLLYSLLYIDFYFFDYRYFNMTLHRIRSYQKQRKREERA